MTGPQTTPRVGTRRMERAVEHVNNMWLPVNSELLQKIQTNLSAGVYDNSINLLVSDIKGDSALFLFCVRELSNSLRESKQSNHVPLDLSAMLERAGIEQLKEILQAPDAHISSHSLDSLSTVQRGRLQEMLVSIATAEELAQNSGLRPENGHTAALLRQFGLALIAWNYSEAYHQAVAASRTGETLDDALSRLLGFSPALLAVRVLESWGMAQDTIALVDPTLLDKNDSKAAENYSIIRTLVSISQVGEALARANDPETHSSAELDWSDALDAITERLGTDALNKIRSRLETRAHHYVKALPHIFRGGFVLDPEAHSHSRRASGGVLTNPFIERASESLRIRLQRLYRNIDRLHLQSENLRIVAHEIIPLCGFPRGCIYTIDPGTFKLVPRLEIGSAKIKQFLPLAYSNSAAKPSVVLAAFQQSTPVVQPGCGRDGLPVDCHAMVLGFGQRVGVLYLESSPTKANEKQQRLTDLKAIVWTVNDCLFRPQRKPINGLSEKLNTD